MKIKESAENYLKTKNGFVRSIDIANTLGYTKASVSVAMKALREEEYIIVSENGDLSLTEKGYEIAKNMFERHEVIAKGLIALGVSEHTAFEDSCKVEHYISNESFEKIKKYLEEKKII